jgi:hypothetical protein
MRSILPLPNINIQTFAQHTHLQLAMKIVSPRTTVALTAMLLVLTSAQHVCEPIARAFPTCARGCINDEIAQKLGCVSDSDYDCLCVGKGDQMQSLVKPCVISACGFGIASSIPGQAEKLCECVRTEKEKSEL